MNCQICKNKTDALMKDVYQCRMCGHIYRDFKGDSIEYHEKIYRSLNNKHQQRTAGEINLDGSINPKFHKSRGDIVFKRMSKIQNCLFSDDNILDIGSGAGTFALGLNKIVPNGTIECLEVAETLVSECRRLGFKTYHGDFMKQIFDKDYSVITCFHVLEHVKDLRGFIDKVSNLSSGRIFFEVPTLKCYFDEVPKTRRLSSPNEGYYDGHYHYFSPESFRLLFEDHFDIRIESGVQSPALLLHGVKK